MKVLQEWVWAVYYWLLRYLDPAHPVALALRAEKALERGEWGVAFDLSHSALKKRDDFGPPYFIRSMARLQLDDYRGALDDLNRFLALTEHPPAPAYYWRGWIYAHREEWRLALADFDRVLLRMPKDPRLLYWRTYVLWQREEWDRMRDALEQLEALAPHSVQGLELRGHLLLHEAEYEKAAAHYTLVIQAGWESPSLYYNRAVARRHLREYEAAKEDLEALLELDPDSKWAHLEDGDLLTSNEEPIHSHDG